MCRAYYRNRVWINEVEPNTLWQRDSDTLVVVDDDNYTPLPYSANQAKFDRAVLTPEEKQRLFILNNGHDEKLTRKNGNGKLLGRSPHLPDLKQGTALFSIKKDQNSKTDVPVWVCQFEKNCEKSQFFVQIDTQTEAFFENLKGYSYAILPVRKFAAWLYGISPERVKPEIRPNLEKYQDFCDEILFEYFFGSVAKRKNVLIEKSILRSQIQQLEDEFKENEKYNELADLKAQEMRLGKTLKELDTDVVNHQMTLFQSDLK